MYNKFLSLRPFLSLFVACCCVLFTAFFSVFSAYAQTCPQTVIPTITVSANPVNACESISWDAAGWEGYYHVYLQTGAVGSTVFQPVSNLYIAGNTMQIADFGAVIQGLSCYRVGVVPVSQGVHLTQYAQFSNVFCMPVSVVQRAACGVITNNIVTKIAPCSGTNTFTLSSFAANGLDATIHATLISQIKAKLAAGTTVKFSITWTLPSGKTGVIDISILAALPCKSSSFATMSDADFLKCLNDFLKNDIGTKIKEGTIPAELLSNCVTFDITSF